MCKKSLKKMCRWFDEVSQNACLGVFWARVGCSFIFGVRCIIFCMGGCQ